MTADVAPPLPSAADATTAAGPPIVDAVQRLHDVQLESGAHLRALDVRYRLEGALSPARDNLVLVVHALTGDVHASNWWRGVVGEACAIDTRADAVLCVNLLGGCAGTRVVDERQTLPRFTTRDQAAVLARLLDALDVRAPVVVCGGSLGGMVTLEFAASFPDRVKQAVVFAAPAAQTAQGLAWNALMRRAIDVGGEREGLALARMIGMLSYRTPEGLERRFGRTVVHGQFQVTEWLAKHGDRILPRFEAASYRALIDTMDTHDVGRNRGGICAALAPVRDRLVGAGIVGDQLYPADAVREWTLLAGATYAEISSPHGHDAFLLETARVSGIVRKARGNSRLQPLTRPRPTQHGPKRLRVALAGCGTVGGALLQLLADSPAYAHRPLQITDVLARDGERVRPSLQAASARGIAAASRCITDATRLLDSDVDVLVEAIGGTTTAATLVTAALERGIRVVTANKALIAARGVELQALAARHGTRLDFEAAVAGAVPVVRCLRAGAAGVQVTRIDGILNGTCNFVLDRVGDGLSLPRAVEEARQLGYAEADPSRDLSGEDAEDKLRILAWLAFGFEPASLQVTRRGIDDDTAAWIAQVAREGDRVRQIASCERVDGALVASVTLVRVPAGDAWADVDGPSNRIVIDSESAGRLVFIGAGAGGRATAGALLADLYAA